MPKITHILFDMDGLLLDTESVYTKVTSDILARFGKEFTWQLKQRMMGQPQKQAADILIQETGINMTVEEYLAERNKGHQDLFPFCKPLPGVLKLVKHLKRHSVPMIVATSSHYDAFILKSKNNRELFDLFDHVITGDSELVERGKPFPDIFIQAAKILGCTRPDECLVFEDSESGVEAGLAAEMNVVWIPDERMELKPELKEKVSQVIYSMTDFVPEDYGLPAYD